MAYQWTNIITGEVILASHANEVTNNAKTLVTLMTANTQKCPAYSCSSLGTIPYVNKNDFILGSWLTDAQAMIDTINNSKYCTTAYYGEWSAHNPARAATHNSGQDSGLSSNYCTTNVSATNSTAYGSLHSTYNAAKNDTVHTTRCYANVGSHEGDDEDDWPGHQSSTQAKTGLRGYYCYSEYGTGGM